MKRKRKAVGRTQGAKPLSPAMKRAVRNLASVIKEVDETSRGIAEYARTGRVPASFALDDDDKKDDETG